MRDGTLFIYTGTAGSSHYMGFIYNNHYSILFTSFNNKFNLHFQYDTWQKGWETDKRFHLNPTEQEIYAFTQQPLPKAIHDLRAAYGWPPFTGPLVAAQTPTTPTAASNVAGGSPTVGYPIGSLIMGTGSAGNVWIVNKDNSKDISLLWDGKGARWCGSELEKQDKIKKSPSIVPPGNVLQSINSKLPLPMHQVLGNIPKWAQQLMLTPNKPQPGPLHNPTPSTAGLNAAIDYLNLPQKEEKVEKKVADFRDSCDHVFKDYFGAREAFKYCVKCDIKRPLDN